MIALAQRAPLIGGAWDWLQRESSLGHDWRHWFGYLTIHNAEAIGHAIVEMLDGREYTFVDSNENLDLLRPGVRTGNVLDPTGTSSNAAVTLINGTYEHGDQKPYAHLLVHDTYGVWGFSTSIASQQEAWDTVQKNGAVGHHHMSDPYAKRKDDWNVVYLSFERQGLLRVQQRTSAGGRITWTIAVEDSPYIDKADRARPNKLAIVGS